MPLTLFLVSAAALLPAALLWADLYRPMGPFRAYLADELARCRFLRAVFLASCLGGLVAFATSLALWRRSSAGVRLVLLGVILAYVAHCGGSSVIAAFCAG